MRPVSLKLCHGCFVFLAVLPRHHTPIALSFTPFPSPIINLMTRFMELDDGRPTVVHSLAPLMGSSTRITMAASASFGCQRCPVLTSCVSDHCVELDLVTPFIAFIVLLRSFHLLAFHRGFTKLIFCWVLPQPWISTIPTICVLQLPPTSTLVFLPIRLSRRPSRCRLLINCTVLLRSVTFILCFSTKLVQFQSEYQHNNNSYAVITMSNKDNLRDGVANDDAHQRLSRGDRHKVKKDRHKSKTDYGHRCICGYSKCSNVRDGFRQTVHTFDRRPILLKIPLFRLGIVSTSHHK